MARILIILLLICQCFACAHRRSASGYVDAMEVKLKCRELADQMLATMPNDAIQGFVAIPTSFVDQNNTSASSQLGRLLGESLFYEFNQRGFPTWEYRLFGKIAVTGGRGDLALASGQLANASQKWGALLVGTYAVDDDVTFINARLVRVTDGLVLRTGQLILRNTPIVERMAQTDPASLGIYPQGNFIDLGVASDGSGTRKRGIPIRQGR